MKRMTSRIFTLILENSDEAHCRHPTAPVLLTPWGVSFLGCASDQSLLGLKPGAQLSGNGSNLNILGNHLIFDLIWASKSQAMNLEKEHAQKKIRYTHQDMFVK